MSKTQLKERLESTELGFWLYIASDIMLFSAFFATYLILRNNTAGGHAAHELFELPLVLLQTLLLLTSSLVCAFALLAYKYRRTRVTILYLIATALLGAAFLGLEIFEFTKLFNENNSWQESAFLSSYYGLVGLHGAHVLVGLLWAVALIVYLNKTSRYEHGKRKLTLFGLFWHFIDIVWIGVFTIVYLTGVGIHG